MTSNKRRCSSGSSSTTRSSPAANSLKQVSTFSRSKTCAFTVTPPLKSKTDRLQPLTTCQTPPLITETLPEDVNKLHPAMVNEISLHSQGLCTIPNLSQFTKLQILDLSCNSLTCIDNLRSLTNLRELKLYGNQIQQIENLDCLTQLQILQLQYNEIEKIGHGLVYLTRLQTLRLDSNKLSLIRPEELSKLSQLKVLDTSDCPLESLEFINSLPSITEFRANHCHVKILPNQLRNFRYLTDLDLSNNQLINLIPLKSFTLLRLLRLASNQIEDIQILSSLIHLNELDLSDNRIRSLPNSFAKLIELQCLNLSNNQIDSWKNIEVLSRLNSLFILNIIGNPLLSEEQNYIDKLSKLCSSLEIIDDVNIQTGAIQIPPTPSYEQLINIDKELHEVDHTLEKSITDIEQKFDTILSDLHKLGEWYNDRKDSTTSRRTPDRKSKHRLFQALTFSEENYQHSNV
ncbi:unnamed protein product [Adineta ricciae]|uniref:Disease resistance R13L4/SHOC-2-like LRR domain-containing protein n=1 Tax=Adineta ricciae TaxID=249248 RepID=A0A814ENY1_ADIRI|nr:unnamed protein product [Adineta ricciae]CAF0974826.1 unnamed protein product [Adineta ricciae]